MKPTINIFFNGLECYFPDGAAWEMFQGLDTARVFLICAECWHRNGWNVKRLSTVQIANEHFKPTRFLRDGECSKSWDWYPEIFWQFIAKAKTVAASDSAVIHWFTTIDVLNFGFKGDKWRIVPPLLKRGEAFCISPQREHFSLALIGCNLAWLVQAERILLDYDAGILPSLNRVYTSDETILRTYSPRNEIRTIGEMTFSCNTAKDTLPLCHFARSAVKPSFDSYQLA